MTEGRNAKPPEAGKMKVLVQQVNQPVQLDDPSEYRPELEFVPSKEKENFRVYTVSVSDLPSRSIANQLR